MDRQKVYMNIGTPFSLKNPYTLRMFLILTASIVMMAAMVAFQYISGSEMADRMLLIAIAWVVMGVIPFVMIIFCSYVYVDDGDLVSMFMGVWKKRIPRSSLEKYAYGNNRIQIYANGKVVASVMDCDAAFELVRKLRLTP